MEQIIIPTSRNEDLEERLRAIAETLEVPDSAYEQATERYEAVGRWLCADGSPLREYNPRIYAQGSFALGTVIRPHNRTDYDIDAVVQLDGDLRTWTPQALKGALGDRLRAHGKYTEMLGPEGRRCWTLTYASGDNEPGFHMDLLASVAHGGSDLLGVAGTPTAIAITNRIAPSAYDWRQSDPKGYAAWFKKRMEQERKRLLKANMRASIEMVPAYAVRTSLQITVQLLKRHRDVMFEGREEAPISVIISTLAARAYKGEASLADTVVSVTKGMRAQIEWQGDRPIIRNPVRPEENFADRWDGEPQKRVAFFMWLDAVETFVDEVERTAPEDLQRPLSIALGKSMADTAIRKYASRRGGGVRSMTDAVPRTAPTALAAIAPIASSLPAAWESARHRESLRWRAVCDGTRLRLTGRVTGGRGARIGPLHSGHVLAPNANLRFEAVFEERLSDSVFWQIVNTGADARSKGQLRGSFEEGTRFKVETALYWGDHFIEAFLIRNGVCVARSGPFTVSVR